MKKPKRAICTLTDEQHRDYKIACAQLGVTMSDDLHDHVGETIVRAAAEREKGNGIDQS